MNYEGTKSLNKAFNDRWKIIIEMETLSPIAEAKLLQDETGIDEQTAKNLVVVATMARKEYKTEKILTYISTRSLINFAELIMSKVEIKNAFNLAIGNKAETESEKRILIDFLCSVFKIGTGETTGNFELIDSKELEKLKKQQNETEIYKEKLRTSENEKQDIRTLKEEAEARAEYNRLDVQTKEKENQDLKDQLKTYEKLDELIKKSLNK
jgi:hypothetical protein